MHCLIVFPYLLKYLTNTEYVISSWPIASESTLVIPHNFLCIWNQPWEQDVGQNFVCSRQKWYAPIVITLCFIPLLMDGYYDRLLPLFRQFLLIPNSNYWTILLTEKKLIFHQFLMCKDYILFSKSSSSFYLISRPGTCKNENMLKVKCGYM